MDSEQVVKDFLSRYGLRSEKFAKNQLGIGKTPDFKVYTNENFKREDAIDVEEEKNITNEEAVKEEVDRILDKISKYGIDTLTKKEKEFLDKAGKQNENNDD